MEKDSIQSVLWRKAHAGQPVAGASPMTVVKALRLAVSKAADKVLGLALAVTSVTEEMAALDPLLAALDGDALLAVLEGPDGALGLVMIEAQALAALVEVQTLGRVTPAPAPPRRPTRTDAAMIEPVINRMVVDFGLALAEDPAAVWAGGFTYGVYVDQLRTLGLILDDVPHRVFRLSVDLGGGAKQGEILLALPRDPKQVQAAVPADDPHEGWTAALHSTVLGTEVQMTAVLHRLTLPLATVTEWAVGDMVTLPASALVNLRLEGADGMTHGRAKLGQSAGFRALRILHDAPDVALPPDPRPAAISPPETPKMATAAE
ncbi:FliM/FliN family flagellar motor switch protein [Pseudogemmobacter sp. W21_MBD1_M6]|uniref:FliM/FliN family flagellar motor switch protein n=1 Tax=Pseudogemmobacter sp. W21_MBD1_M6 TaxID=3240271 RepID=UPI003F97B3D0